LGARNNGNRARNLENNFVPKNVTAGQSFDHYREYCKAHNRSYRTHTETSLRAIEKEFDRDIPLARITTAAIEKFKLGRVKEVSEATVDKYPGTSTPTNTSGSSQPLKRFVGTCGR